MRRWIGILALLLTGVVCAGSPDAQEDSPLSGAAIFEHLEAQCALGPRNPGSEGHRACAEYIVRVVEEAGGRVTRQSFLHKAPGLPEAVELTNVLARFGPQRSGGLLLGAHWDTRPWADRDPDPEARDRPILGANDGGSGTAVLLALAQSFQTHPPPVPVLLAFFDGEDLGRAGYPEEYLAGSRYFAEHLPTPFPEMGLVLDMVASRTMVLHIEQQSRGLFPEAAALLDRLAVESGVPGYVPGVGPIVLDDHIPLIQAGIPTLLLVDFRDPVWHTLRDVPANCSPQNLERVGRLVDRLIRGGYFR